MVLSSQRQLQAQAVELQTKEAEAQQYQSRVLVSYFAIVSAQFLHMLITLFP